MDKRHKIVPLTLAIAMTMALVLPGDAAEAAAAVGRLDSSLPAEELIRLALKGFGSR